MPHTLLCCIDTQSHASSMSAFLHMMLVLAHLLHSLYIAIRYACDAAYGRCAEYWRAGTTAELIRTLTKMKRIPRHLVIVSGLGDESVLDCVRIITWSTILDIPYISFFDRNGNKSKICVSLLSNTDGKGKMGTLAQSLAKAISTGNLDPEDITDLLISEKLQIKGMPDPDLALIYGNTYSTHGVLPWHTRTTEFLMLPLYVNISVKDFTYLLERYSKCKQRHGK
ncbi:PREDICTED: dehydrodolichyl diphosphate syntase complex subunit NUS1 isoform X2 [Vollenhovia emeryi]|uniref:dehydrodolichyl diphosphate syntase complex subunit NUS1 isoform X2 n=1 Tax=Vollenhovia emeryi TaxID=411798 RepID=UPI0005F4C292|nr:PREDICTED: dehydrodolichyl diphosphate syntase complex subunit NUS1 isoform X2 [Vollenhovia emeryi]